MVLASDPKWNFDPRECAQTRVPRGEKEDDMRKIHQNFVKKYNSNISLADFQQAAFCLAGLAKAGLVTFIHRSQNDPRYFIDGTAPPLPPKIVLPLKTTAHWTVDCFLARFAIFGSFVEQFHLESYPSPIQWLEAQLEEELRLQERGNAYSFIRPWKGHINDEPVEPVVDWEMLKGFEWQPTEFSYPQPFVPSVSRQFQLSFSV